MNKYKYAIFQSVKSFASRLSKFHCFAAFKHEFPFELLLQNTISNQH